MAVRETSAFRQHGRPIEDPLNYLCPPLRSTFAVRETASLGQQMLNATVGINGLYCLSDSCTSDQGSFPILV